MGPQKQSLGLCSNGRFMSDKADRCIAVTHQVYNSHTWMHTERKTMCEGLVHHRAKGMSISGRARLPLPFGHFSSIMLGYCQVLEGLAVHTLASLALALFLLLRLLWISCRITEAEHGRPRLGALELTPARIKAGKKRPRQNTDSAFSKHVAMPHKFCTRQIRLTLLLSKNFFFHLFKKNLKWTL